MRSAQYVALGSSFAAGIGLGPRAVGSPILCSRSANGYPQQLAKLLDLTINDVTCSGATTKHVLHGGQFFQKPQIYAIGNQTELVSLTIGGNDVRYVGDLMMLSYRANHALAGFILRCFWDGPKLVEQRPFARLQDDLTTILHEINRRATQARVVVVTYPAILPPTGSCAKIGITEDEAVLMRDVGARLAEVTCDAAQATGATIVDMATLSAGHDACSPVPWVNGAAPECGVPFHPTLAGAQATAKQIMLALDEKP